MQTKFSLAEMLADPDRVLVVAVKTGRAVVVGEDGQPDIIISVLQEDLELEGCSDRESRAILAAEREADIEQAYADGHKDAKERAAAEQENQR